MSHFSLVKTQEVTYELLREASSLESFSNQSPLGVLRPVEAIAVRLASSSSYVMSSVDQKIQDDAVEFVRFLHVGHVMGLRDGDALYVGKILFEFVGHGVQQLIIVATEDQQRGNVDVFERPQAGGSVAYFWWESSTHAKEYSERFSRTL
jgi:hypothetical protein